MVKLKDDFDNMRNLIELNNGNHYFNKIDINKLKILEEKVICALHHCYDNIPENEFLLDRIVPAQLKSAEIELNEDLVGVAKDTSKLIAELESFVIFGEGSREFLEIQQGLMSHTQRFEYVAKKTSKLIAELKCFVIFKKEKMKKAQKGRKRLTSAQDKLLTFFTQDVQVAQKEAIDLQELLCELLDSLTRAYGFVIK